MASLTRRQGSSQPIKSEIQIDKKLSDLLERFSMEKKNGLKTGIMSFTVQKDVEEGKIKINHVEFFRTQKRIRLFYKLTS